MRVHIFGASGSGVTTLGHRLSDALGVPYFDTDSYHWVPVYPAFSLKRASDERGQLLTTDLGKQPGWILGGTVYNWGDYWVSAFDLAVYLWLPAELRMSRLVERERKRNLPTQSQLAASEAFLEWASHYDTGDLPGRSKERHQRWIEQLKCPVIRLEGDTTVAERLAVILDNL